MAAANIIQCLSLSTGHRLPCEADTVGSDAARYLAWSAVRRAVPPARRGQARAAETPRAGEEEERGGAAGEGLRGPPVAGRPDGRGAGPSRRSRLGDKEPPPGRGGGLGWPSVGRGRVEDAAGASRGCRALPGGGGVPVLGAPRSLAEVGGRGATLPHPSANGTDWEA